MAPKGACAASHSISLSFSGFLLVVVSRPNEARVAVSQRHIQEPGACRVNTATSFAPDLGFCLTDMEDRT